MTVKFSLRGWIHITNIRIDRKVHKTVLLQILKEIYTDTSLGPVLGLKGGTAAHLFYDLGRFSVDLDFDLLDETKENHVFVTTENILKGFGTIKRKAPETPYHFLCSFLCRRGSEHQSRDFKAQFWLTV
jgi:Uncharacterized conserved protein